MAAAPASRGETRGRRRAREQTRARYPDAEGYVERDGVRVFWERYGDGERTVLLLPTWSIVHSRSWKLQIPYLARHCRVVTFDGRGNGRSDRPVGAEAYSIDEFAADALAVMDATATERATLVALSCGALWGTILAADHPERVDGIVYIGPAVGAGPEPSRARRVPVRRAARHRRGLGEVQHATTGAGTTATSSSSSSPKCFNEPHSTKQIEDCIGWALETTPETLADATRGIGVPRGEAFADAVRAGAAARRS